MSGRTSSFCILRQDILAASRRCGNGNLLVYLCMRFSRRDLYLQGAQKAPLTAPLTHIFLKRESQKDF